MTVAIKIRCAHYAIAGWKNWYASVFYDLGGLDAGATVHFIGQMSDNSDPARKIREWTTLDLVANYTFRLPQPVTEPVPGYARDGGKNAELKDGEGKNVMPVSTAEYNPWGWRGWLNNTTITVGMNNVFDQDPPFVAGYSKTATTSGRSISGGESGMWR
jgi:hypothetical protein